MNAVLTKPLSQKKCSDILESFIPSKKSKKLADKSPFASDLPDNEDDLFNLSEFQLLDIEEGLKTTGSEKMLNEMLELLVKDSLPEDVSRLKIAHDDGDWELTQKLAHKIKGGVVYIWCNAFKNGLPVSEIPSFYLILPARLSPIEVI